jgi:hypothetical protein
MDYRLFRLRDREPVDALEAHVLARAYLAAWRVLYLCEPVGQHALESLGLAIDFGGRDRRRH